MFIWNSCVLRKEVDIAMWLPSLPSLPLMLRISMQSTDSSNVPEPFFVPVCRAKNLCREANKPGCWQRENCRANLLFLITQIYRYAGWYGEWKENNDCFHRRKDLQNVANDCRITYEQRASNKNSWELIFRKVNSPPTKRRNNGTKMRMLLRILLLERAQEPA